MTKDTPAVVTPAVVTPAVVTAAVVIDVRAKLLTKGDSWHRLLLTADDVHALYEALQKHIYEMGHDQ